MNNKSVSDFVAASMNAVLESAEHKSLFGSTYKTASLNKKADDETFCSKEQGGCGGVHSPPVGKLCNQEKHLADDNSANDKLDREDCSAADDNFADGSSDGKSVTAFDIAIDGLLTASAALDSVGFSKSSSLSLELASFIVEAAKKEKAKAKKKKEDSSSSSSKGKKDDKKSDKKEDKKDDKKKKPGTSSSSSSSSGKKSMKSPFAKKK